MSAWTMCGSRKNRRWGGDASVLGLWIILSSTQCHVHSWSHLQAEERARDRKTQKEKKKNKTLSKRESQPPPLGISALGT